MKKHGFEIERNRPMRYGYIVHFFYKGEEGWLMVYKNLKIRTIFCFSFIYSTQVINQILCKVKPEEVANWNWKFTIPDDKARGRIRWWRETKMRRQ